jgi:hypothetical protein
MTTVDEMVSELFGSNSRDVERDLYLSRCHELHARAPARASTIIITFQRCALPSDELLPGRGRCAVYLAPSKMSCDRLYHRSMIALTSMLSPWWRVVGTQSAEPHDGDNHDTRLFWNTSSRRITLSVTGEDSKHLKKTQRS